MTLPILATATAIAAVDALVIVWMAHLVRTHHRACDAQVIARLGALSVTVAHSRAGAIRELLVVTLGAWLVVSLAFLMGLFEGALRGAA